MPLSLLFSVVALLSVQQCTQATVCRSVRIHSVADGLRALENCTVVEGYVMIVLIHSPNHTTFDPSHSLTQLREITDYLVINQVKKLRSIGDLFPNLERIGGRALFSEETALVIADVLHLEEIGLYSLREISRGSVAITRNPSLCYLNTIDWKRIMKWDAATTHFYDNSLPPLACPACSPTCPQGLCWNSTKCQIETDTHSCHPLCAGGCQGPAASDCHTCRHAEDAGGSCVERCPPHTFQLHSRCVSREDCNSYWHIEDPSTADLNDLPGKNHTYAVYKDQCVKSCPALYQLNAEQTDCLACPHDKCDKTCVGGIINSVESARRFRGCTFIRSSIGIHINSEFTRTVRQELEDCLGSIEKIHGYLKVSRSSITDLNFFKNLSVIDGNDTNKYALFVVDNPNIQELWDWSSKRNEFTINGRLFFHFNPKLCLQKIYTFLDISGYKTTNSDYEIGKGSNGYKIPCKTTKASVSVVFTSHNFISLRLPRVQDDSSEPFRYVVFYTKDTFKNITIFEDLDPCSDNAWRTVDKSDLEADDVVTLSDLEPDTQYACYFTTYSNNSIGARSEISYVSTLPTKPSELAHLKATSNSSSEIYLQWEPPTQINGKLKEYIVTWFELPDDDSLLGLRDYCAHPIDFSAALRTREVKNTKTKNNSSDYNCCTKNVLHLPKEGFGQLCKNFKKLEFPVSFNEKLKSVSCESYFSSYISESPFRSVFHAIQPPQRVNRLGPNALFENNDEKYISESKSPYPRMKTQQENIKVVSGESSETVLSGLKHYTTYAMTVKACRETSPQELSPSDESTCSKADIVITRTQKSNFADNITSVNYTVTKQAMKILWKPPEKPNGLVVAFEIEFKRKGQNNGKNMECIRCSNNNSAGIMEHSISQLPVGKYEFRVRAVTLSGKGLYTRFHSYEVVNDEAYSELELLIIILLLFVFVTVIAMLSRCWNKQSYKSVLVTECNPNYHYVPDPLYEMPRENVDFGAVIGEGMFGKVFEGKLRVENRRCAIKTLIDGASERMENEFLREADLMKSLNGAYFVVKLLGVVSVGSPALVLMELMTLGDLKNYLRSTRETQVLGNATMIQMAVEIADAMTYMEAHKFVHRDLAARNCMVGDDMTIKVGDFGMARDVYETDYYRKSDQGLLPIRWMAPESLRDGEFTSLADVWSYGVVLWEIVSRAEQPYQGLSNDQVLQEVIAGETMDIPPSCPAPLAAVMGKCWKRNPQERTDFMRIMVSLSSHHRDDEQFRSRAYFYTPEAENRRNPKYEMMQFLEEPLLPAIDEVPFE